MNFEKYKNQLDWANWRTIIKDLIAEIDNTPLTKSQRDEAIAEAERRAKLIEKQQREAYNAEEHRLKVLFQSDCAVELDFAYLPQDVRQALHDLAWSNGHSGGYNEVYNNLCDLVPLVTLAYKFGKRDGNSAG